MSKPKVSGVVRHYKNSRLCLFDTSTEMLKHYPNVIHSIYGNVFKSKKIDKNLTDYAITYKNPTTIELRYDYNGNGCNLRINPVPQWLFIDVKMSVNDMRQLYEDMKTFFGDELK